MKNECIYPDWEGGFTKGEHHFGKDNDCIICGKTKESPLKEYHIIYTDETGEIKSIFKEFIDFDSCEEWLKSIHAIYWEIGI